MTARAATFRRKPKEVVEYPHHLWKPGFQGDLSQLRRKLRTAAINAGGGQVVTTGTDLLRVLEGLDHYEKANEWASSAIEALAPTGAVIDDSADAPGGQVVNLVTTMRVVRHVHFLADTRVLRRSDPIGPRPMLELVPTDAAIAKATGEAGQ